MPPGPPGLCIQNKIFKRDNHTPTQIQHLTATTDEIKEDLVGDLKKWWSTEVELEQYADKCIEAGYENIKYIQSLKGDETKMTDFVEAIGIEKAGHIMIVKEALIALNEKMKALEEIKQCEQESEEEESVQIEDKASSSKSA